MNNIEVETDKYFNIDAISLQLLWKIESSQNINIDTVAELPLKIPIYYYGKLSNNSFFDI